MLYLYQCKTELEWHLSAETHAMAAKTPYLPSSAAAKILAVSLVASNSVEGIIHCSYVIADTDEQLRILSYSIEGSSMWAILR